MTSTAKKSKLVRPSGRANCRNGVGHGIPSITPVPQGRRREGSCCCLCARQLCCNSAVDTDDLILREEREHLLHMLQPLEEAQDLCGRENCKTMAVDVCLCPLGCKKPTSCGSACNHCGFTYGYRLWQLVVLIFCWLLGSYPYWPLLSAKASFERLLCTDHINMNDTDIKLDWNFTPMYCPSVQQILRTSNYTKGVIGYPGAFKSMQALGWYSSLDYYLNGTSYNQSQIWHNSDDDTFVLIDYKMYRKLDDEKQAAIATESDDDKFWDEYKKKLEKIREEGTHLGKPLEISKLPPSPNSTNPGQLYCALNYDNSLNIFLPEFIYYRAFTKTRLPFASSTINICFIGVTLICCFASFSIKFQKDDPNELMYPARLEIKKMRSDQTVEYHFVRPRKLVLEFVVWFQLIFVVVGYTFFSGFSNNVGWYLNILWVVILPTGAAIGITISGLIVQVNNATTLSNILAIMLNKKNAESWSIQEFRERIKQWKELYKTSVGALHVWSWRMTPIMGGSLLLLIWSISEYCINIIAVYISIMTEIDIPEPDRFDYFIEYEHTSSMYIQLSSISFILLLFISAIAKVSIQYKKLNLLIATARLPEHHLDDFMILQQGKAALTIFDFPITAETTITFFKVFLIQGAVLTYTALA